MITNFVRVMLLANAAWLTFGGAPWNTGNTFDAALFVAGIPLFLVGPPYYKWWVAVDVYQEIPIWEVLGFIGLVCMLPHMGGTAWAIFIAQIFGRMVYLTNWSWLMLPIGSFVGACTYSFWRPLVIEHQTRLLGWATYLDHWWEKAPVFIGFGADTFRFRAAKLEVNGQYFTWAHNDYVEVLFDTGFVGFAFMLVSIWFLYRAARNDARLLSALFGFCACMMFYSPLQVITGQLLAVAIAALIAQHKFKGVFNG